MAQVTSQSVFPSIRHISTSANGDLQEVVASVPTFAELTYQGSSDGPVLIKAQQSGLSGNDIRIQILDNQGGSDRVEVDGNDISVKFADAFAYAVAGTPASVVYNSYLKVEDKEDGVSSVQFSVIDNVISSSATPAVKASATSGGLTFEADTAGAAGNNIQVTLTESSGSGSDVITVTGSGTSGDPYIITLALDGLAGDTDTAAIEAALNGDSNVSPLITVSGGDPLVAGTTFSTQLSGGADANLGSDEVKIHPTDGDISVCLTGDYTSYTNVDIYNLLTDVNASWFTALDTDYTITKEVGANDAGAIITGVFDLSGGADASLQTAVTQDIVTLLNDNQFSSQLVVASGGSATNLPEVVTDFVNLAGATATVIADLEGETDYILIKRDEIHDLASDEFSDARKVTWGILESYAQHALGLSAESQPTNFILARGNPTLVLDEAGTRIRQTYTINAFYAVDKFDLENEV